ncbi:MAG: ferrochelatase [Bacteroidota bacterium]
MKRSKLRWAILVLLLAAGVLLAGCQIDYQSVAVLFVAHGEPASFDEGKERIIDPDGTLHGPFAPNLIRPYEIKEPGEQYWMWAALYEEVAEALTYQFGDMNGNGILHELRFVPEGDVPRFFSWTAFREGAKQQYAYLGGSPHNAAWKEHVERIRLSLLNKSIDVHLAYMEAKPTVAQKVWDLVISGRYDKLVVVPLLLSESTHTQEIRAEAEEWIRKAEERTGRPVEVVWAHPFFTEPYVRTLHAKAVAGMVQWIRETEVPSEVTDDQIGVVLASHGDPYPPPYPEFGWQEGEVYSHVYLMEKDFHDTVAKMLPYGTDDILMGNNEFRPPSVDQAVTQLIAKGKTAVIVVPASFPTTSMHTMWDIGEAASGLPPQNFHGVPPANIACWQRTAGGHTGTVYYSSRGYGDQEPGASYIRDGMRFVAEVALLELFEKHRAEYEYLFK